MFNNIVTPSNSFRKQVPHSPSSLNSVCRTLSIPNLRITSFEHTPPYYNLLIKISMIIFYLENFISRVCIIYELKIEQIPNEMCIFPSMCIFPPKASTSFVLQAHKRSPFKLVMLGQSLLLRFFSAVRTVKWGFVEKGVHVNV